MLRLHAGDGDFVSDLIHQAEHVWAKKEVKRLPLRLHIQWWDVSSSAGSGPGTSGFGAAASSSTSSSVISGPRRSFLQRIDEPHENKIMEIALDDFEAKDWMDATSAVDSNIVAVTGSEDLIVGAIAVEGEFGLPESFIYVWSRSHATTLLRITPDLFCDSPGLDPYGFQIEEIRAVSVTKGVHDKDDASAPRPEQHCAQNSSLSALRIAARATQGRLFALEIEQDLYELKKRHDFEQWREMRYEDPDSYSDAESDESSIDSERDYEIFRSGWMRDLNTCCPDMPTLSVKNDVAGGLLLWDFHATGHVPTGVVDKITDGDSRAAQKIMEETGFKKWDDVPEDLRYEPDPTRT